MKAKIIFTAIALIFTFANIASAGEANSAQVNIKATTKAYLSATPKKDNIQDAEPASGIDNDDIADKRENKLFNRRTRSIHSVE